MSGHKAHQSQTHMHEHGPYCGHLAVEHGGHRDYLHDGQLHHGHGEKIDTYGQLIAMGVIDPVKVVRVALQNAASVAGLMLTTECLIAQHPEEAPAGSGPADHGSY